jgi:hypothetical protein
MITKILSQQLPTDYEKFKNNIFSQNGEDGLIEYFLQKMQKLRFPLPKCKEQYMYWGFK